MLDTKAQVAQAIQAALAETFPNTNSGSHKVFVVGQIVVNVQAEPPQPDHPRLVPETKCCCGANPCRESNMVSK